MDQTDLLFLIVLGSTLLFGLIVFVLSCIYYVKKGHVIIVEKMEKYFGTFGHGFHWFVPFVYHRVGYYAIVPIKRTIRLVNGRKALIEYQITDPLKFHYIHTTVEHFINNLSLEKQEINLDLIKSNFSAIGITFISIKPID